MDNVDKCAKDIRKKQCIAGYSMDKVDLNNHISNEKGLYSL